MNHIAARRALATLLLACVASLIVSRADACECEEWDSLAEEVSESTYVFQGTVTSVDFDEDSFVYQVLFDVEWVWKGSLSDTVMLSSHGDEGMCGRGLLQLGATYIVFTGEGQWADRISSCSSTTRVDRLVANRAEYAAEMIAELDALSQRQGTGDSDDTTGAELRFPNTGTAGPGRERQTDVGVMRPVAAVGILAATALVMVCFRSRRSNRST